MTIRIASALWRRSLLSLAAPTLRRLLDLAVLAHTAPPATLRWSARWLKWRLLCRRGYHRAVWREIEGAYQELTCPLCLAQLATRPRNGSTEWTEALRALFPPHQQPPPPLPPALAPLVAQPRLPVLRRPTSAAPGPPAPTKTRPSQIAS